MQDFEREIVDKVKMKIISDGEKKPFSQTKLGVFLATDWWAIFVDKMASILNEYVENNSDECESVDRPIYHLSSIFPTKEIQEEVEAILAQLRCEDIDRYYKRMISEYLDMSDEDIEILSWEEIDELILAKYKKRFPSNVKYLLLSSKAQ